MSIEIANIKKSFGRTQVLNDISLDIPSGQMVALLGPSGSGKTTLLRIIAGLEHQTSGHIRFHGTDVSRLHARDRKVGFVFQHYALFRHMTVFDNIAFGLTVLPRRERPNAAAIKAKVTKLLEMVQLAHLADRYPAQLSGGQKQRVALARALAVEPQILLLDEPFGALDPVTRGALQQEMTRIHRLLGRTIVLVTHDIDEALRLAEHLVLMDGGEIVQQGTPLAMLTAPTNDFVQQFFGRSELGVRLLSLRTVADYVRRDERIDGEALTEAMTLRDALSAFVAHGRDVLPVVNRQGMVCGTLHFRDLLSETLTHETTA